MCVCVCVCVCVWVWVGEGLFQDVFYFGYMLLFCVALSIMCGAVGFLACYAFTKKIYSQIRID